VSKEKYSVAPGGRALPSATIHGVDSELATATSALCRASWIGSSPLVSAFTFCSHVAIATPFGNVDPFGSVCSTIALMSPMSLVPRSQVARGGFTALNGPVLNQA
jgi:hypothetical protein